MHFCIARYLYYKIYLTKVKSYFHFEGCEVDFSLSPVSTSPNVAFSLTL